MACILKYLGGNLLMLKTYFEMPHKNKMVWWMLEGWIDIWQSKYSKMLILEFRWRISRYSLHLFQLCCIVAIFHNEIIENSTYNIKLLYLLHPFCHHSHSPAPTNFTITYVPPLVGSSAISRQVQALVSYLSSRITVLPIVLPHSNPPWMSLTGQSS